MRRAWLAIALLSGSWLLGVSYFQDADFWAKLAWFHAIAAAVFLLYGVAPADADSLSPIEATAIFAVALPACWIAPGVYRAIPLLVVGGSMVLALRPPLPWLRRFAGAALLAAAVLVVQAIALYAYESLTARSHELPGPLASALAAVARLAGAEAALATATYGHNIELFTMRRSHPLGATWELLLDPATVCFLIGGILLILLTLSRRRPRAIAALAILVIAWLPLRVALLVGLYLHRALMSDYDAALDLMNQFFSPWVHLALLVPPMLLAWRFVPRGTTRQQSPHPDPPPEYGSTAFGSEAQARRELAEVRGRGQTPILHCLPALATCIGVALLVAGLFWCPSGPVKSAGRILWDEYHSTWEPTSRPYDTDWYGHDSGYNYSCIYDYCSRFYDTDRLTAEITPGTLRPGDILISKVPTSSYSKEEIDQIERFVQAGGGLMCIGEHTDVFGTSTHLNDITRRFGFTYRFDCAFGIKSVFEELYEQPLLAHPIVQRMPPLDFEISCTIDPAASPGRAAMRATSLKNAWPDYHASNFYPQVEDFPDARYGSFVQMWATEQGQGRVAAFSDSTQFSNFSTFEPGKPEMFLGMIQWLRRANSPGPLLEFLTLAGAALTAIGVVGALIPARRRSAWMLTLAAGLLGWAVAVPMVRAANRRSLSPTPPPQRQAMVRVGIDRTVCDCTLSKAGFIGGKPDGFGIFERWVLRLGWFTFRQTDAQSLLDPTNQLVIFFQPHLDVTRDFRDRLEAYVKNGGHVLILDSPENEHSAANSLLYPFGLSVRRPDAPLAGAAVPAEGMAALPSLPVTSAAEVTGGQPVARLVTAADQPGAAGPVIAAGCRFGKGSVTVIGFASRFADANMGVTGDMEPNEDLRKVYEFEFRLLRGILGISTPTTTPTTRPAAAVAAHDSTASGIPPLPRP
jgi:hypothetical protein